MNKSLLTAALLLSALAAPCNISAAGPSVTVVYQDGSQQAERVFDLTENLTLKFSDDKSELSVGTTPAASTSFKLADIAMIKFNGESDGIEATITDQEMLRLIENPVGSTLRFNGTPSTPCTLNVYSLQGSLALSVANWNGEDVDAGSLTRGFYLLNFNNQSIKFYKK